MTTTSDISNAVARHQQAERDKRMTSLDDLAAGGYRKSKPAAMPRDDLRYQIGGVAKALYELARQRHGGIRPRERQLDDSLAGLRKFQRELYGRLYNKNSKGKDDTPADLVEEVADHIHKALDDLPAWQRLQDACHGQSTLSAVSTCELVDTTISQVLEQWQEQAQDKLDEDPATNTEQAMQQAIEDWCDGQEESDGARAQLRAAVTHAVEGAQGEADDVKAAIGAGFGLEPDSTEGRQMNQELALELAGQMARDERFRRIVELLGRFRDTFKRIHASEYADHGQTPYSVTPGDDLRTLLSMERSALANPATSMATLHRLQLRQTLCYQVRSKQPKEMGPFWILLDTSGSMSRPAAGTGASRLDVAAAFCLAALHQAADDGRAVGLITFCGTSDVQVHDIDLTNQAGKLAAMQLVARLSASGGTPMAEALRRVGTELADDEGADVLMVSDGQAPVSDSDVDKVCQAAELHCISIFGGGFGKVISNRAANIVEGADLLSDDKASDLAVRATRRVER